MSEPKVIPRPSLKGENVVRFKPQPGPQSALLTCPIRDILFGGARGGGKSYGTIGHFASRAHHAAKDMNLERSFDGLYLRRTFPELEQLIIQAKKIFEGVAEWRAGSNKFVFPLDGPYRGATLQFHYLDRDDHAEKFQGKEFQWICVEEAQNFPQPEPIDKIRATLRSAHGVPTYFLMTANPGGRGHNWIKIRYIDPAPPMTPFITTMTLGGEDFPQRRVYIPARLSDNLILMANDPNYRNQIAASSGGQEWLYQAWMEGNWDIMAGGMFDDLWDRRKHVLEPFVIPRSWRIYRAYDWGSSAPFSIGWWAKSDGVAARMADGSFRTFPTGTLIRIAEWYGCSDLKKGLHMLERDIVQGVLEREAAWGIHVFDGPADTMIFDVVDGRAIATAWEEKGINWERADKSRGTRVTRWQQMRDRLEAATQHPMEYPGMFVFSTCLDWIRTVPASQRDQKFLDDIDTKTEDHCQDETGYMCLFEHATFERPPVYGL